MPLPPAGPTGLLERYRVERIEQMYQPGTNRRCTTYYFSHEYVSPRDLAGYRQRTVAELQTLIRQAAPDARVHKIVINLYYAPLPKNPQLQPEMPLPPTRVECR